MKLSNIRVEDISKDGKELSRLVCDVENCSFSKSKEMYYIVPREFAGWLADDVYDSFIICKTAYRLCCPVCTAVINKAYLSELNT